jgi:hypothetical protein
LFAEQGPNNGSTNALKGGIAKFTARVVRKHSEESAQALIRVERAGCEPKPPYAANIHGFVIAHLYSQSLD